MADVIQKINNSNPVRNGSIVVNNVGRGQFDESHDDVDTEPDLTQIVSRLDNRMDDYTFYSN